jgi:hypothetical protein
MSHSTLTKGSPDDDRAANGKEGSPGKRRSFIDYCIGTILSPRSTFEALRLDERRLRFGIVGLAITIQLYSLVYIFLSIGGQASTLFKPWLAIPASDYFHYNEFLLIPTLFMGWILAAGATQLLSRIYSGKGSFEDSLSAIGFAIGIASLPSLAHDLPESFLGALGLINLDRYQALLRSSTIWHEIAMLLYSLSLTWCAVLFCVGIGATQRLRRGPAIITGLTAYAIFLAVFLMSNR